MDDKTIYKESGSQAQQEAIPDNTSLQQTTSVPNAPQQGKVNKIDNNTKLQNEEDTGDLNEDD